MNHSHYPSNYYSLPPSAIPTPNHSANTTPMKFSKNSGHSHQNNLTNSPDSYGQPGDMDMINGLANGLPMFPRSASEAIVDNGTKYRQLPCRTFISVGTCPYRERCVYLHDPRCICREAKTKTRRKNKDDVVLDSLFWPIMPYNSVAMKLDNNRQPHVIQPYNVPPPQNDSFRRHDEAVYSMWMHFVDFCLATTESQHSLHSDLAPCFAAPDFPVNAYTKLPRLPVFRLLSQSHGCKISRDEYYSANLGHLDGSAPSGEFAAKSLLMKFSAGTYRSNNPDAFPMLPANNNGSHGSNVTSNLTSLKPSPFPAMLPMKVSQDEGESVVSESLDQSQPHPTSMFDSRRSSLNDGISSSSSNCDSCDAGHNGKSEIDEFGNPVNRFSPDAISQLWKQRNSSQVSYNGFNSVSSNLEQLVSQF